MCCHFAGRGHPLRPISSLRAFTDCGDFATKPKNFYGAWLSLARARRSGRRGHRFKSCRPDHSFPDLKDPEKDWSIV